MKSGRHKKESKMIRESERGGGKGREMAEERERGRDGSWRGGSAAPWPRRLLLNEGLRDSFSFSVRRTAGRRREATRPDHRYIVL